MEASQSQIYLQIGVYTTTAESDRSPPVPL